MRVKNQMKITRVWSANVEWHFIILFLRSMEEETRKLPRHIFGTWETKIWWI